jgi:proteasome lid subunit RPN8/RPN11
MISQAYSELPNECCGFLAGNIHAPSLTTQTSLPVGRVECRFPLVNSADNPKKYEASSKSLIEAHVEMRRQGIHELAIYHSHPVSAPIPSRTDLERNYYPNAVHFIISLQDEKPTARAWWLTEIDFREADWRLTD